MKLTNDKPLVYLAGGMEKAKNNGEIWRANFTPKLEEKGYQAFNPCIEEHSIFAKHNLVPTDLKNMPKSRHVDKYNVLFGDIVDYDLSVIERCDLVVVYYDESVNLSSGTTSEMTFSRYLGKPLFVVRNMTYNKIPSWSLGCPDKSEHFFNSFDECLNYIVENNYKKEGIFKRLLFKTFKFFLNIYRKI